MSTPFFTRVLIGAGIVRKHPPALQMKTVQESLKESQRVDSPARPTADTPPGTSVVPANEAYPTKVKIPVGDAEVVHTVIPATAKIVGNVEISESVVFQGIVRGDVLVHGDNQVVLARGAGMHGSLSTKAAVIGGEVEGNIDAERVILLESARVHGDITYNTLAMAEGAVVNGRLLHKIPNVVADDAESSLGGAQALGIDLGAHARVEHLAPAGNAPTDVGEVAQSAAARMKPTLRSA